MTLRQRLFDGDSDRAVSPVIGVILMVAITVILAAVIGTFVLGLTEKTGQTTPQASLQISDHSANWDPPSEDKTFVIQHTGGEDLPADSIEIRIRESDTNRLITNLNSSGNFEEGIGGDEINATFNSFTTELTSSDVFSTNDKIFINAPGDEMSVDTQYKIVIYHPESGRSISEATVTLR